MISYHVCVCVCVCVSQPRHLQHLGSLTESRNLGIGSVIFALGSLSLNSNQGGSTVHFACLSLPCSAVLYGLVMYIYIHIYVCVFHLHLSAASFVCACPFHCVVFCSQPRTSVFSSIPLRTAKNRGRA